MKVRMGGDEAACAVLALAVACASASAYPCPGAVSARRCRTNSEERVTTAELAAMRRAFELARRGPRSENPQVGAVLLSAEGQVLAEGWHCGAGSEHAEAAALKAANQAGRSVRGATAVVSLEPCNHTGRTPACSTALIEAGIARVVYSIADPNPTAAGGAQRLREAKLEVVGTVLAESGEELLREWLAGLTPKPQVILKIAQTLDAKVAAVDHSSRWITGEAARADAHRTRSEVDAVLVGTGTVLADDPALTARRPDGSWYPNQPRRIVVGERQVPSHAAVRGPGGSFAQFHTTDLAAVLSALAKQGVARLLVEGGPTVATALLRAGMVDELHCYLAPKLLGAGTSALADLGIFTVADAQQWQFRATKALDPDLLIIAKRLKE